MKITVYGSWHLAEVYAVGLVEMGHQVCLVSNSKTCRNYLNGVPPVIETGVAEGLAKYSKNGNLILSDNLADSQNKSEICFFAEDITNTKTGVDLKSIKNHFLGVARSRNFKIICVSSQLPLGSCRAWQLKNPEVSIVYFPEFLRFGDALRRFLYPDYLVFGGASKAVKKVKAVFAKLNVPKFTVSLEEAEMTKHAANIFVAMSVSFASELAKFSDRFNIDLSKIGEILRHDKRVGSKAYIMPGLGFSGAVARDLVVLKNEAKKMKTRLPLFEAVMKVNNEHNKFIENELRKVLKNLKGKKIGFLGATYKPFTSNMRGSLIAPLLTKLSKMGARPILYDPQITPNVYAAGNLKDIFSGADAVVIAVGKKEFKNARYAPLIASMKKRNIIDAANLLPKDSASGLKLNYYSSIGRGK